MNLAKKLLVGAAIVGAPIVGAPIVSSAQGISKKMFKEMKKELGVEYLTQLRNLGHGYWSKADPASNSALKYYSAMQNGGVYSNGKRAIVRGTSTPWLSEEALAKMDNGNKIITLDEIQNAIQNEYAQAFEKYAEKTLGVPKNEIADLPGGYKTTVELKERLSGLKDLTKDILKMEPEDFYKEITGKDGVIIKEEFLYVANEADKVLKKHSKLFQK
jgi:hypothetical protein